MDFKKIIDHELSDITVTEQLKQKTIEKIHSPKKRIFHFNYMKFRQFSLVSSFIVIFVIGINIILPNGNEAATQTRIQSFSVPNLENKQTPSDNLAPETTTESSEEENNEKEE